MFRFIPPSTLTQVGHFCIPAASITGTKSPARLVIFRSPGSITHNEKITVIDNVFVESVSIASTWIALYYQCMHLPLNEAYSNCKQCFSEIKEATQQSRSTKAINNNRAQNKFRTYMCQISVLLVAFDVGRQSNVSAFSSCLNVSLTAACWQSRVNSFAS